MTAKGQRYRCLVCTAVVRRPGKHSNHRHPGEVRFEAMPIPSEIPNRPLGRQALRAGINALTRLG